MKTFFSALCRAAMVLFLLTGQVVAYEITEQKTPDGYDFTYVHMPKANRTAVSIAWVGGYGFLSSRKENIEELGPILMINGGAGGLSPDEVVARFNAIDSGARLYLDDDALRGFIVAPAKDLGEASTIANKVLAEPTFDPRWLKRFQRNYVENVRGYSKTPKGQAWLSLRNITVGNHPLRQVWNGTPTQNISSITIDDVSDWYARTVTTDGLEIAVAGDAKPTAVAEAIDTALRALPSQNAREDLPPLQMHYPAKTILIHRPEAEKSFILIGGPIPPSYSVDYEALQLATGVLGVSDQSRLFTAVRKELRASYGFSAHFSDFTRANGMLYMQGEVETAKLQKALETVQRTYETFRTVGVGMVEFPFAHRIFKNRVRSNMDKPDTIAHLLTEAQLTGRSSSSGLQYLERVEGLSRAEVNAAILRHFPKFDDMVKIVVSPDRDAVKADCVISAFSDAADCR
ncbi:pitrilysin family protein [Phaeobacter sp. 11ANDIMAR09]|uniref:M16 family metallopeptidase n=1 Tax=Phaeobacter sp. 11ANDIMAR09 TaxID=1225647 RepID=UPI0006C8A6AF|nr:insulinase family protein [Phaeobacter sp. 11ANDIMAR09]KPD10799.1 hypothetical protein AN476_18800 [Phaeobacter sp. 11ANDIMAR09]